VKTAFYIALFFSLIVSCRKEKKPEADQIHVSYFVNGDKKHMQPPLYGLSWSNMPGDVHFSYMQNLIGVPHPFDGFTVALKGRMETRVYQITGYFKSAVRLSYTDSNDMDYRLERGSFSLSKIDSLKYVYKGNFEGTFVKEDDSDSFVARDGDFYFQRD
jgi:hypothetical protein